MKSLQNKFEFAKTAGLSEDKVREFFKQYQVIIDQLKNIFQVEHSRHRSQSNFFNNVFSALIAYNFSEKKPSLKINFQDTKQLILPL